MQATYDRIAPHFSQTRRDPWPEVVEFPGDGSYARALDLGCGNGRHIPVLKTVADAVIGIDISRALLQEAVPHISGYDALIQGDACGLPVGANTVDLAIYVATLHHIPERAMRIRSLDELARVLRPDARALVSVWSVTDDRFDFAAGQDRLIPWTLPSGDSTDRFYHIFDRGEFESELEESTLHTRNVRESSGNWYAVVESA